MTFERLEPSRFVRLIPISLLEEWVISTRYAGPLRPSVTEAAADLERLQLLIESCPLEVDICDHIKGCSLLVDAQMIDPEATVTEDVKASCESKIPSVDIFINGADLRRRAVPKSGLHNTSRVRVVRLEPTVIEPASPLEDAICSSLNEFKDNMHAALKSNLARLNLRVVSIIEEHVSRSHKACNCAVRY